MCVEIKCSHSSRLPFRSNASIVGICPDRELSSDSWDSKKKKNLKNTGICGILWYAVVGSLAALSPDTSLPCGVEKKEMPHHLLNVL